MDNEKKTSIIANLLSAIVSGLAIVTTVLGWKGFQEAGNMLQLFFAICLLILGMLVLFGVAFYLLRQFLPQFPLLRSPGHEVSNPVAEEPKIVQPGSSEQLVMGEGFSEELMSKELNKDLKLVSSRQDIIIEGCDLTLKFASSGIRIAENGDKDDGYIYTVGADSHTPFRDMSCSAKDTAQDSEGRNKIRPILLSDNGKTKTLLLPFLEPVPLGGMFKVEMQCKLFNCMKSGTDTYFSCGSFVESGDTKKEVYLIFRGDFPVSVNAYEVVKGKKKRLIKALMKYSETAEEVVYVHVYPNIYGDKAFVYEFKR